MALSESGGSPYPATITYGWTGHRKTVKPRKGPASAARTRRGKGTTSFYVRPRSGRKR